MSEDLRHRYAEALADHMKAPEHKHDGGPFHGFAWDWECCADAVLAVRDAVRDTELEQVKDDALAVVAEAAEEREAWRERAETAEAAIARVRALHKPFQRRDKVAYCDHCSVSAGSPLRRYVLVAWPCETLAALDDTREDEDHG